MANHWFNQFGWTLEKAVVSLWAQVDMGDTSVVTTTADTAGSLASTFFRIKGFVTGKTYMFWFKVSGSGTNPATGADTAIEVDISTGATNTAVAAAVYAAAAANTSCASDFTITTSSAAHTVTFVSLAGGCSNLRDGLSAFATHFTLTNTVYPVLITLKSKGIKSITRTGAGLYTVVTGTPSPTSVIDLYNRVFDVQYRALTSAAPAAPYMFVVSQAVSTTGAINVRFLAANGLTSTDPACGESVLLEIVLKNTSAP